LQWFCLVYFNDVFSTTYDRVSNQKINWEWKIGKDLEDGNRGQF